MTVPTLTYGSEISTVKKQETKIEIAEMKFLRSVAGYRRKDQMRNTKGREELNVLLSSSLLVDYVAIFLPSS
jgi:hypothetical protein